MVIIFIYKIVIVDHCRCAKASEKQSFFCDIVLMVVCNVFLPYILLHCLLYNLKFSGILAMEMGKKRLLQHVYVFQYAVIWLLGSQLMLINNKHTRMIFIVLSL